MCNPIDGSPPGFPIPGIPQAITLEWVAISFSNSWKWKAKVKLLSPVRLFATPWTAAYQASPSMGFSRQEYWSGVPLPSLMTDLDSVLKSRDITLPTKIYIVKATNQSYTMVFPVGMYGCNSWTIKEVECWRIDDFELWCWRRLFRVPWTARRSSQSIPNNNWDSTKEAKIATQNRIKLLQKPFSCGEKKHRILIQTGVDVR